ncbi:uncharacterized protein BDW43DRAFT_268345 [Aspergillus alliaceus]|uniref:uncharacterized protein n=1 Tax=Petromyces alliaceus TaxID=209559 RepID=UPI0012A4EA27|nr:uncharacterized protein BDW43DRAFT_268345 [Aspergillus alliaceus]KAB8236370.1 hypothetical protein BDW43DRAFT_268345 [Aspergillus alliaceus]
MNFLVARAIGDIPPVSLIPYEQGSKGCNSPLPMPSDSKSKLPNNPSVARRNSPYRVLRSRKEEEQTGSVDCDHALGVESTSTSIVDRLSEYPNSGSRRHQHRHHFIPIAADMLKFSGRIILSIGIARVARTPGKGLVVH